MMSIDSIITFFGCFGLFVSFYAIYVERKARRGICNSFCDISDRASCSRVLTSPYSRMTGLVFKLPKNHPLNLPNTYFGILFYLAIIAYPQYPFTLIPFRETLLLLATSGSMVFCFVLAYILYFKLKDFCVVCVTTYFINGVLLWCAYNELFV